MSAKSKESKEEIAKLCPLYDYLLSKGDIVIDVLNLCHTINNLPEEHISVIYVLILHHYHLASGKIPSVPPYCGSVFFGGRGIKILWNNLPPVLCKIIAHYINENKLIT